ncbi:MAG: energy transducer TonB [Xanthobacteraceae bacterium]|nr:energy transducer TonB [Xanthobacteraceae bacterium]
MIGSAPKPARRDEEAPSSATILPFRLRASRVEDAKSGKSAPAVEIESKSPASAKKRKTKASVLPSAERPTILPQRYRGRLQQTLIGALLLHLVVFALLHFQFVRDVERAANAGGVQSSDGTVVLDIDIVAEAKLPPSKLPTNMTAPDASQQTNTPPQIKQQEKQKQAQKAETAPDNAPTFALPKEELAAPRKAETSTAAQSPNQEKKEEPKAEQQKAVTKKTEEQKKKQEQAAPSIAAAPNRAAANNGNQSQTGANGFIQNGGQADASSYNAIVLAHLQQFRVYPEQARAAKITGVSTVRFTLGASGNVISVSLAGTSGTGILDQAALAMVQRASPFPPIPPSLGRGSMTFAAPVRFNLR